MKKFFLIAMGAFSFSLNAELHFIEQQNQLSNDPRELYIDLMKRCLTNMIYEDPSYTLYDKTNYSAEKRTEGQDWPVTAHTMIGMKRLHNLHYCVGQVLENQVPGDFIETGVWRGGATIFMRAILKAYNVTDRLVWVADSFQGLPPPNVSKYPADAGIELYKYSQLAVSMEQVQSNFSKYGLLDNQVVFLKGLFSDTLPTAPIDQLAILRLDGDLYESTMDALVNLYPKLSEGGYVIVDDYFMDSCKLAIHHYRNQHNIQSPIVPIDTASVYWKK